MRKATTAVPQRRSKHIPPRKRSAIKAAARHRLPKPTLTALSPLKAALQRRQTEREIANRALPTQILSDLLWAACGVNRRRGPFGLCGRTAGSASNSQEIDIYVLLGDGAFRYQPLRHRLDAVTAEDLRPLALGPGQAHHLNDSGVDAPVRLIYVADIDRLTNSKGYREPGLRDPDTQRSYFYVDTGLIAANVYLFAAARGLAAWFHNCDRQALVTKLGLRPDQRPLFGHTIGYPARRRGPNEADRGPRAVARQTARPENR